jgi:hypothetical protein
LTVILIGNTLDSEENGNSGFKLLLRPAEVRFLKGKEEGEEK